MVFLSKEPSGRVMNEVWNEGTAFPHVKYYYGEADESMFKDFVFVHLIITLINTYSPFACLENSYTGIGVI